MNTLALWKGLRQTLSQLFPSSISLEVPFEVDMDTFNNLECFLDILSQGLHVFHLRDYPPVLMCCRDVGNTSMLVNIRKNNKHSHSYDRLGITVGVLA